MIKGLHHSAYRCLDSEKTRAFYEDFLGLPLAQAFRIEETATGRKTLALHTFYVMRDGSFLAFFEVPDAPFDFKNQHDFDLHIALEVERPVLSAMLTRARALGIDARGISDHGVIESVYFRDPNGYVVELACKRPSHTEKMNPALNGARVSLDTWQASKLRT